MIVGFLLYLAVEGKFAATLHSAQFETRELCMAAIPQLRAAFPDLVRGGVCVQNETSFGEPLR